MYNFKDEDYHYMWSYIVSDNNGRSNRIQCANKSKKVGENSIVSAMCPSSDWFNFPIGPPIYLA